MLVAQRNGGLCAPQAGGTQPLPVDSAGAGCQEPLRSVFIYFFYFPPRGVLSALAFS